MQEGMDEELALNLYRNTMTGNWESIVEMHKQHTFSAISARINSSRDTALHVAVSIAPENNVRDLIRVISNISEPALRIKNDKGNTPLHVAASTGRLKICILLATILGGFSEVQDLENKDLYRNKAGETPLFLAAFHGYKPIFLYLHMALLEATDTDLKSVDPGYRRNDGETALHCAIKWEYFGKKMEDMLDYQGDDKLARDLFNNTLAGKWQEVVDLYELYGNSAIFATINTSGDTAFHIAVSIAAEDIVQKLAHLIADIWESGLWIKNNDGNTPLHVAASTGKLRICNLIADDFDFPPSRDARNKAGESPLFLAAFHGHKDIFLCLHMLSSSKFNDEPDTDTTTINPSYRRNDGETILHCAIRWEYFDLAFEILHLDSTLTYCRNEKGFTPLHLLASKPSVFKSGCHRGWWKNIIYLCIPVEELKKEAVRLELIDSFMKKLREYNFPVNYRKCIRLFQLPWIMAKRVIESTKDNCKGRNADVESHGEQHVTDQTSKQKGSQSRSEARGIQFVRRRLAEIWFTILYISFTILKQIFLRLRFEGTRKLKKKHVHSVQIMKMLIKYRDKKALNFSDGRNPGQKIIRDRPEDKVPSLLELREDSSTATASKTDQQGGNKRSTSDSEDKQRGKETPLMGTKTPMLLAAENGIIEMVDHILKEFQLAISDKSESDGKNIVLSAMKNRQTTVLQLLFKCDFVKHKLIHEQDMSENNALHLAAELGEQKPWLIPGAALQMQWEIKWYEFVKDHVPHHFRYQVNKEGKTPEDIFNKNHEQLVKEGGEWLNKTSESCSVVAALIATVAFAASTTIPGDINDKSGIPNLENQSAITIFATSSLFALCFSITALFSFLAILTSRYERKDFRRNLPMKLLIGLTSLFVSIASMLVSFCAGHYFTLKNKLKDKAFPVYAVTCLPIVFFAIQQLPLYLDIIWAIYKTVPRSSYKVVSL